MAKSRPGVRYHHTQQDMVCRASHGRLWSFRAQKNRAVAVQVLHAASRIKGTVDHAPETESWRVALPASEINIQAPSTQWQTSTSIHFWKAPWYGRGSATPKWDCRLFLPSKIGQEMWLSPPEQLHKMPHSSEWGGAFPIHLPDFVRGAS